MSRSNALLREIYIDDHGVYRVRKNLDARFHMISSTAAHLKAMERDPIPFQKMLKHDYEESGPEWAWSLVGPGASSAADS